MKQTAVEYLYEAIDNELIDFLDNRIDLNELSVAMLKVKAKAKEMEKEQIIKAVDSIELVNRRYYKDGTFGDDKAGKEIQMTGREYIGLSTDGKAYYNETYGGDQ